MTLSTRKNIREYLAGLLLATGSYAKVYDYPEKRLQGYSPAVLVVSRASDRQFPSRDLDISFYDMEIVHLVKRDASSTFIDTLDNLELILVQTLRANLTSPHWEYISYNSPSVVRWGQIDDQPYVMEIFNIRAKTI